MAVQKSVGKTRGVRIEYSKMSRYQKERNCIGKIQVNHMNIMLLIVSDIFKH